MKSAFPPPKPTSWRPLATVPPEVWGTRTQLVRVSETLSWLHKHWDLQPSTRELPRERGIKGAVRKLAWRVMRPCFARYFKEEQDLLANLVRMVDLLAKQVDHISASQERLLGTVRTDLVDLAGHVDGAIAEIGRGA